MKTLILLNTFFIFLSFQSVASQNFHIGALMIPNQVTTDSGLRSENQFHVTSPLGLSLGYTSLETQSFGWSTQFNFSSLRDPSFNQQITFLRWDGSLAYSINSVYSLKAGPTVTRRFGGKRLSRSMNELIRSHGLGYQVRIDAKLSPKFLVNFGYSETHLPSLNNDGFRLSGPELEMAYLF